MKLRAGFVSNSSTTSFCIYGIALESKNEIKQAWNKLFPNKPFDNKNADMYDACEEIAEALSLEYQCGEEGYCHYIGTEFTSIPEDITPKQFKKSISDTIKSAFGEDAKCGLHEESYRDG